MNAQELIRELPKGIINWYEFNKGARALVIKEELQQEMEEKFSEIDKKKKFEYYAQIDDDFRDLYLEYEDLNKKEVK